jgi:hypothetical protein
MKQVWSDGLHFEVRDISEPLIVLEKTTVPIPIVLKEIVSDEEARKITKRLLSNKLYRRIT